MSTTSTQRGAGPEAADSGHDLCLTCANLPGCVHRHTHHGAVMFCELYEEGPIHVDPIAEIVKRHREGGGGLIAILEEVQGKYGFLPEGALRMVADRGGYSMVDIYGVATFYRSFSLKPRGRHVVSVCLGTACHVRQGPLIARAFEQQLGVAAGDTSPDGEFTLETVNCLGACALGPIVVVDGHYFSQVRRRDVAGIIGRAREGVDRVVAADDARVFPVAVHCARCNHSLMDHRHPLEGHPSVRVTISFERNHGWLRLSSLYGSHTIESEHEIPQDTVVNFFCPHCHAELLGATDCPLCGAPMVPLIVRGGGMVQICSRRGCRSHMLDLNGVNF